jgi:hypothetical protein
MPDLGVRSRIRNPTPTPTRVRSRSRRTTCIDVRSSMREGVRRSCLPALPRKNRAGACWPEADGGAVTVLSLGRACKQDRRTPHASSFWTSPSTPSKSFAPSSRGSAITIATWANNFDALSARVPSTSPRATAAKAAIVSHAYLGDGYQQAMVYRWEYADALTGWPKAILVVPGVVHGGPRRCDEVVAVGWTEWMPADLTRSLLADVLPS